MRNSRVEDADLRTVSEALGVTVDEVRRAVHSFFDDIADRTRRLPFSDTRRIYRREAFDRHVFAVCIPSVGRLGPVYSRYLKWLENEAAMRAQQPRSAFRSRRTVQDIEAMAEDILSGKCVTVSAKKRGNELYERVWIVDSDGKRLARQVIPKNERDV